MSIAAEAPPESTDEPPEQGDPDRTTSIALRALESGISVIPIGERKTPAVKWKQYQSHPPDAERVASWFKHPGKGIGLVCGDVSGGLELLEFEGRAMGLGLFDDFRDRLDAAGHSDLLARVEAGYTVQSPSGGVHLAWRSDACGTNERPVQGAQGVLAETRGEGGYFIAGGSPGACHPSGRPWVQVRGGVDTIERISGIERTALLETARSLQGIDTPAERPCRQVAADREHPFDDLSLNLSPGGQFDRDNTCDDVLLRAGFTPHSEHDDRREYTRPGKDPKDGASAAVWTDNGTCTLFSTSIDAPAEYLTGKRKLRPFQLHAALNHGGDFTAATRARGHNGPPDPSDRIDQPGRIDRFSINDRNELFDGYAPADMTEVLAAIRSGGSGTPAPILLEPVDDDGPGLFYPAAINSLHGDSGCGKTWVALKAAQEAMANDGTVLYVDLESTAHQAVERLQMLGCHDDMIRDRFIHISPQNTIQQASSFITELVEELGVTMAVFDSLGEAFGIDGVNEDRDNEVTPWMRDVLRPLAGRGVLVLTVDHATKSKESPLFASGSKRKRAAVTGAAYLVEAKPSFSKDSEGRVELRVAKDRHGARPKSSLAALIRVEPSGGGRLTISVFKPKERSKVDEGEGLRRRVLDAVRGHLGTEGRPVSQRELMEALRGVVGGVDRKRAALDALAGSGLLVCEDGPRRALMYSLPMAGGA